MVLLVKVRTWLVEDRCHCSPSGFRAISRQRTTVSANQEAGSAFGRVGLS